MVTSVRIVSWVIALILGATLALFAVQNPQTVSISVFGLVSLDVPASLLTIGSAAAGALIVVIISLFDRLRWFVSSRRSVRVLTEHKKMIVQRDNRIHELEQELFRLRGVA